jgi:hypothetical protein
MSSIDSMTFLRDHLSYGTSYSPASSKWPKWSRMAPVNHIDGTSWLTSDDQHWLWVMANPLVAYFRIRPNHSKTAFVQLITDWMGILVSDGSLVY